MDESTAQKLGKGLGAGYMLTGSYLIMGETMRIDARLVNVATGEVSMGEEITGEKNTFFELEKDLVEKLITTLDLTLSRSEERKISKIQTKSFNSFLSLSNGLDAFDEKDYSRAKEFFEKAIDADPDYDYAYEILDQLEENLESFIKAKKFNLSEDIYNLIIDVKNKESDCSQLAGAISQFSNKILRHSGLLQEKINDLSVDWSPYGFNKSPTSSIDVAKHIESEIIEYLSILSYLYEERDFFSAYCGTEGSFNMPFLDYIFGISAVAIGQQIIYLELINIRKDVSLKGMQYVDNLLLKFLAYHVEKYPYSVYVIGTTAPQLKKILYRIKNPIVYDIYKDIMIYSPELWHLMPWPYSYYGGYTFFTHSNRLYLHKDIKLLNDDIKEIGIYHNPYIKGSDGNPGIKIIRKEIDETSYVSDTSQVGIGIIAEERIKMHKDSEVNQLNGYPYLTGARYGGRNGFWSGSPFDMMYKNIFKNPHMPKYAIIKIDNQDTKGLLVEAVYNLTLGEKNSEIPLQIVTVEENTVLDFDDNGNVYYRNNYSLDTLDVIIKREAGIRDQQKWVVDEIYDYVDPNIGLRIGDIIFRIDGENISNNIYADTLLYGQDGSMVSLSIEKTPSELVELHLNRKLNTNINLYAMKFKTDVFYLPDELFDLTNLEKIDIENIRCDSIAFSDKIKNLSKLKEFDTGSCDNRNISDRLMELLPNVELK